MQEDPRPVGTVIERRLPDAEGLGRLVEAAIRVVARVGVAAANMRTIAEEAGLRSGSLHRAFRTRADLFEVVVVRATEEERLSAWLAARPAEQTAGRPGIAATLRHGLEGYLRMLERDPARKLAVVEAGRDAARHRPESALVQVDAYRRASEASLVHAAIVSRVRWTQPVGELAGAFTTALQQLTRTWLADRDGAAARATIADLADGFADFAAPLANAVRLPGDVPAAVR